MTEKGPRVTSISEFARLTEEWEDPPVTGTTVNFVKQAFVLAIRQQLNEEADASDIVATDVTTVMGENCFECTWHIPRPLIDTQVSGTVIFGKHFPEGSAAVRISIITGGAVPRFPRSWSRHHNIPTSPEREE